MQELEVVYVTVEHFREPTRVGFMIRGYSDLEKKSLLTEEKIYTEAGNFRELVKAFVLKLGVKDYKLIN